MIATMMNAPSADANMSRTDMLKISMFRCGRFIGGHSWRGDRRSPVAVDPDRGDLDLPPTQSLVRVQRPSASAAIDDPSLHDNGRVFHVQQLVMHPIGAR